MRALGLLVALLLLDDPAAVAEDLMKVRPGRWEYEVKLDMSRAFPGLQLPRSRPSTRTVCITSEEARRNGPMPDPAKEPCKVSNYRSSRTEMTYTIGCETKTVNSKTVVHSVDSFTNWSTTVTCRDRSQMIDIVTAGRRIGDVCTAEELAEASERLREPAKESPDVATRGREERPRASEH